MILGELLRPEVIEPTLRARGKSAAIRELVGLLIAAGDLPRRLEREAVDAVIRRERSAPTGMEMGVALPHGTVPGLDRVRAALAISEPGISFGAIDKQPAHVILLMLLPRDQFHVHVQTLAAVSLVLSDESVRDALRRSQNAVDVMRVIQGEERRPSFLSRFRRKS